MTLTIPPYADAALLLSDGGIFFGRGIGAQGTTFGEVCFNTGMSGYQEVLTDLSYAGQIIVFTFPHIGNVGINEDDAEAVLPAARGLVIRENITQPSNFRSTQHLQTWLAHHGIIGIAGVDTRALTHHIRKHGAQNAAIIHVARGTWERDTLEGLYQELQSYPSMKGMELAEGVSIQQSYTWNDPRWSLHATTSPRPTHHVVAIDYGAKLNILRSLISHGCKVTVVPATTLAHKILELEPDGVFLSNGPGDPSATGEYATPVLKALMEKNIPIFGICLGHQLLGIALGGRTEKLHQGHRGANHPVKNLINGMVEITSQNHGFAVVADSLPPDVEVTHVSLFDGTVEGLRHKTKPIFSVQYHPESSPGPHDSRYLFDQFVQMMEKA